MGSQAAAAPSPPSCPVTSSPPGPTHANPELSYTEGGSRPQAECSGSSRCQSGTCLTRSLPLPTPAPTAQGDDTEGRLLLDGKQRRGEGLVAVRWQTGLGAPAGAARLNKPSGARSQTASLGSPRSCWQGHAMAAPPEKRLFTLQSSQGRKHQVLGAPVNTLNL